MSFASRANKGETSVSIYALRLYYSEKRNSFILRDRKTPAQGRESQRFFGKRDNVDGMTGEPDSISDEIAFNVNAINIISEKRYPVRFCTEWLLKPVFKIWRPVFECFPLVRTGLAV
jgi:hypothetical protein